jgi:hypothetical protein
VTKALPMPIRITEVAAPEVIKSEHPACEEA